MSHPEIDLQGVDSIEVLKGPASALYGRFEPGGVVNLVSKKPELTQYNALTLRANVSNAPVRCLSNLPLGEMLGTRHKMSQTVRAEVSTMMERMGVISRAAVLEVARKEGWVASSIPR